MKNIFQVLVSLLLFSLISFNSRAQSQLDTLQFEVKGVCGMCKERIEEAGLIKGVKFLAWNQETSLVKAIYKEGKITEKEIHQAIANVGHSTSLIKASKASYEALPACCAYESGVTKH